MICTGYFRRQEREWERTRFIGTILLNLYRKKGAAPIKPEDLVPLTIDQERKKNKLKRLKSYSKEDIERLKKLWK